MSPALGSGGGEATASPGIGDMGVDAEPGELDEGELTKAGGEE